MEKRVLVIEDYSSIGNCSLTAGIPILSAFGTYPVGLPTALLSTQTAGIKGFTFVDLCDNMIPAYKHWKKLGIKFDCVYIGFLGSQAIIDATEFILKQEKKEGTLIAFDPAMAESGKLYAIFDEAYKNRIIELCKKYADILMPNFTEGKMFADLKLDLEPNEQNARMILNILKSKGYKSVLLSGVINRSQQGAGLLNKAGRISFAYDRHFDQNIHGAGDVFSSAFIGKLMQRASAENAMKAAVAFTEDCIEVSLKEKADLRYGLLIEKVIPNVKEY